MKQEVKYSEYKTKGTLILDSKVFNKLHQELMACFTLKYKTDPSLIIDYQLYGFNNFNEKLPSIKKMVDEENKLVLNGKYLYNKWRQFINGIKFIKISREYSYAYFHCLGYKDVYEFLERSSLLSDKDKKDQLAIAGKKIILNDYEYYLGYYVGEKDDIIKTKLIISTGTKEVELALYYWEGSELNTFEYYGSIVEFKNIITIFFRKENSRTERDAYLSIYYGNENVINKPFLKGLYAGYDIQDRPVSGEIIFQRINSAEMLEEMVRSKEDVDPVIGNYLFNKRLIIEHLMPQNLFELSRYSQYVNILTRIEGVYTGTLSSNGRELKLIEISILKIGSVKLILDKFLVYEGCLQIDNNESIFTGSLFNISNGLKLYISVNGNLDEKLFLTGSLMGSFEKQGINIGKFCLVESANLPKKNDLRQELQQYEINNKSFLYSDLFKKIISLTTEWNMSKNNGQKKAITTADQQSHAIELDIALKKIIGDYFLLFFEKETGLLTLNTLSIFTSGATTLILDELNYLGEAQTFSGGLLALNYTSRNNMPFFSQVIVFVGNRAIDKATYFKGVANFLNNDLKPASFSVILIPKRNFKNIQIKNLQQKSQQQILIKELKLMGVTDFDLLIA